MKVISLGWGVQSFTMAAMVALGELEPVDAAIHADTTHERSATYEFAKRWTPWLEEHGVKVVTVQDDKPQPINEYGGVMIPAFTQGMLSRQCTANWKRAPMRRWLQKNRDGESIEMLLGISWDEMQRMKQSDVKYISHHWPLIDRRITRQGCTTWLLSHDLEVPVKSSCIFCPYHNKAAWRELRLNGNGDWQKAIEVDEAIRKARPPYDLFVHPSRFPLRKVGENLDAQPNLFDMSSEECSGVCFV